MGNIDKNYKLKGLYFEKFQMAPDAKKTLIPVEISVSPEEVLYINQLKAGPEAEECPVSLDWGGIGDSVDTTRAKSILQWVIKDNMVFSFVPIKSGGMTTEDWEQVRKRQLLKITNPRDKIQTPVIWINPEPELLKTPRFVCCNNRTHLYYPNRWKWDEKYPNEAYCPPVETNLRFPQGEYAEAEKKMTPTSWVNRDLVDTAYSALKNPVCQKSPYYSLYFKGCDHEMSIDQRNEFYESAMKEIFQGRHTQNENYVRLPGCYDGLLHLSNIWKIQWKKINGLFYINIRLRSNGFKTLCWSDLIQFCKRMKKTDDTIERWMETSGIKPRFFRKINEYTYVNRHGEKIENRR